MGFVRNVKYFCGKRYFETDLFEVPDMGKRGKKMREKKVNLSSPDQVRRNKKKALRTFCQKVKTNFTGDDVYLTLTYDTLHKRSSAVTMDLMFRVSGKATMFRSSSTMTSLYSRFALAKRFVSMRRMDSE